jgi:AraC family transcriptional regulator
MNDSNNTLLEPEVSAALSPRFETAGPLLIAGLREPLDEHAAQKIPALWQQLQAQWNDISQRVSDIGYGLCISIDNREYFYMAGCAVWDFNDTPASLSPFIIPSQRYAVFTHQGNVNRIRDTIDYAFDQWLPSSGYALTPKDHNSLHFFERYGENFNAQTGLGEIEVWLPIAGLKPSHSIP